MIDNFKVIEKFMQFNSKDEFFKFECLVRNTDGDNSLYSEGQSNSQKQILIKSWFVDSKEHYEKIKHEMVELCNLTGGRLYVTLDKKSVLKVLQHLLMQVSDYISNCLLGADTPAIKKVSKLINSISSKGETSVSNSKTIMFDVDTKDEEVKQLIIDYVNSKTSVLGVLETKKGYHIFCYRKFDYNNWTQVIADNYVEKRLYENMIAKLNYRSTFCSLLKSLVTVNPNSLGLVYMR